MMDYFDLLNEIEKRKDRFVGEKTNRKVDILDTYMMARNFEEMDKFDLYAILMNENSKHFELLKEIQGGNKNEQK